MGLSAGAGKLLKLPNSGTARWDVDPPQDGQELIPRARLLSDVIAHGCWKRKGEHYWYGG